MQRLLRSVHIFWDWHKFLRRVPGRVEVNALFEAYRILKPTLAETYWPDQFPYVKHIWPSERELGVQYALLVQRFRSQLHKQYFWRAISSATRYRVRQVRASALLQSSLGSCHSRKFRAPGCQRIFLLIDMFLRGLCDQGSFPFFVSKWSLCIPGHAANLRRARRRRRQWFCYRDGVSGFAQLFLGPLANAVVIVLEEERNLDVSKLSANFDMDPKWHSPSGMYPEGCYHIVRFGHRLRFLCPPETPCESWGSLLHILFEDMRTSNHSRIRNCLFIKEAGLVCCGGARDEMIIGILADCMLEAGKNPNVKKPASRTTVSFAVRNARRSDPSRPSLFISDGGSGFEMEDLLEHSVIDPPSLDEAVATHLRQRFQRDHYGQVLRDNFGKKQIKKLNLFPDQFRHSEATASVWRARLQAWLSSEGGREWAQRRIRLVGEDDVHGAGGDNC